MEYRIINIHDFGEEELQLWFTQADSARQERILRLSREEDRRRSLCADHLSRVMLSERLGCKPAMLAFRRSERGKPYLEGTPLHFNLSHSGNYVACAVASTPVGIDIEALRSIRPQLCKKVCSQEELSYVHPNGVFSSQRFLLLWTAKEAALKLSGLGISTDLTTFPVMQEGHFFLENCRFFQEQTEQYVLTIAQK